MPNRSNTCQPILITVKNRQMQVAQNGQNCWGLCPMKQATFVHPASPDPVSAVCERTLEAMAISFDG